MIQEIGGNATPQLASVVERIERLEQEKADISGDIKQVYAEAKDSGFDVKALRKIIAERKIDAAERAEMESVLDIYRRALGMLAGTPLGNEALRRDTGAPLV